jgi:HD-like signal output (HDOD) protein
VPSAPPSTERTIIRPTDAPPSLHSLTLERLLATEHLPTPPAVAMQVVQETSSPDVTSARVSEILRQDPALCARVLKAINSVVYGMREQVTSVDRAVLLLGLNAVRGIVLALSLPAMQTNGRRDRSFRDYWQSAVGGAVIGRELAVRLKVPTAEDDMLAGLLRDIGRLLLQQVLPDEYADFARATDGQPFSAVCAAEREAFGVDHAEVSAALLRRWNLPDSLVQPIRHHHDPAGLAAATPELVKRCERLEFVDALSHLDVIAQHPAEVDALLQVASARYGMSQGELVKFLEQAVPKVTEFTALLNVDAGASPNYAATLATGSSQLFMLTIGSGTHAASATLRAPVPPLPPAELVAPPPPAAPGPPEFRPEFLQRFPEGGCVLDGYELNRVLGRGAMGVVFAARDPALDRPVAIKMMLPDLAGIDHYRQRFIREAKSVAAIRSENVVAIYAVKDNGPYTHLCMELVEGESLADRIAQPPPLTVEELTALATQLARGLGAAHSRRIVHRDVKPENILLDRASKQAKLTDFGLAQVETDVRLTTDGNLIGTPLFMSPEQATGQPVGPRSDLFSLGSVLYAAATGESPFADRTMFNVLKKVAEAHPAPPSHVRPDLPEWFDRLVMRLLTKAESGRQQTADEVLLEVTVAVASASAAAEPPRRRRR